jgi:hypothetical protein
VRGARGPGRDAGRPGGRRTSGGAAFGPENPELGAAEPAYWPQVVSEQATRPVTITHGVREYTENYQTVGGAQNAQIMDVNLADPNVRFGLAEAGDELVDPSDETISSMANRTRAGPPTSGSGENTPRARHALREPRRRAMAAANAS